MTFFKTLFFPHLLLINSRIVGIVHAMDVKGGGRGQGVGRLGRWILIDWGRGFHSFYGFVSFGRGRFINLHSLSLISIYSGKSFKINSFALNYLGY